MSQQDSRADALVAAACRIRPIDAVQNRNPQVVKVGMAVKRRTVGASPGIDSLLLHELDATAVGQPDKRHIKPLGHIRHHENVFGLSGNPRSGHNLIIKTNDNRPLPFNLAYTVDDTGTALFVVSRIVESMQRAPGAIVDQVVEAVIDCHSATSVHLFRRDARVSDPLHLTGDDAFLFPHQSNIFLGAPHLSFPELFADLGHFFEVRTQWCLFA